MKIRSEGCEIIIDRESGEERHSYSSEREAAARARWISNLLEWEGTPFRDCAAVKGPTGAVDCAMLMWAEAPRSGMCPELKRPSYHPRWLLHRNEELFVKFLVDMGAREISEPRVGDVHLYFWGRVFAHAAIRINSDQVLHSYAAGGSVMISPVTTPLLVYLPYKNIPRPIRYFDIWQG